MVDRTLTYRQKSLYASLAVEILLCIPYFFLNRTNNSLDRLIGLILSIAALQLMLRSIVRICSRNQIIDERDRLAELRGFRAGYLALKWLMIIGIAALWPQAHVGAFIVNSRLLALHFLNLFLSFMLIASMVRITTQILAYKRSL